MPKWMQVLLRSQGLRDKYHINRRKIIKEKETTYRETLLLADRKQ